MVNVIRGSSAKPVSSQRLAKYFEERTDIEGTLYIGYPIIGTPQGGYQIDALLVSRQQGVIIFNIDEGKNYDLDIEGTQDESITKLEAKLLSYKELVQKRKLIVNIYVATYSPSWTNYPEAINLEEYPVLIKDKDIDDFINECQGNAPEYFEKVNSVIQAVTTIRKKDARSYVVKPDSRGAKLKKLEDSIANLDETQSKAVLETTKGVQRIRGLAGSGKTIVLALKVAYLHATHPDWNIAVTFYTRSLKDQYKDLITRFSYEHKNSEPDWEKVKIIHAWGSPKIEGIYYELCKQHNIEYLDFSQAKTLTYLDEEPFEFVCQKAFREIKKFHQYYDLILIDEAQDFPQDFLRLCYEILKDDKRLVYAYDELQSLNSKVMDSPEVIFGNDNHGNPRVKLENLPSEPQQDVVLNTCYRNSRPILSSAHALGFGVYYPKGLIQMFDNPQLWQDIGYEVEEGELKSGKFVKLIRTTDTSPKFLEEHSSIDDIINFKSFDNNQEQFEWLVEQIEKNLKEDELRCQDIMVIHPLAKNARNVFGKAREMLFTKNINSHLAGSTSSPDEFFQENSIAFTQIYHAKGNEAPMVYFINAQECLSGSQIASNRNILFTAMTRSKAWLRVIGYGENMQALETEFQEIKSRNFALEFTYPTPEELQQMKKVYRDTLNTNRYKNDRDNEELIAKLRRLPSDEKNKIIKILQE
ncbi:MAG: helicase [Microcystis viridis Mv_BB_P_19951000_S69]|uniref:Helicase n=1 Tax=Microcystis viridis Mv_BB_P_19951000_S68D TaxID=2486270 RepID=A0A552HVL8_MICVR|nr:MAG: helicase [Microcystis viridis Mv_BB_P_19951000_S68]TRU69184.1 MAG: helicase [Microcystis viridis Mv_BB_P_19951000_S69]TRU75264.1 MAG: helicase [Microcystis viridis Mv_BB_P_19951000_S68D]TRU88428.1 MAG: helicase [Microcystis viridis Mv_BB_P_19951000_S69D]